MTATPTSPGVPTTITNLAAAGTLTGSELVPIVQNGVTVRTTAASLVATTGVNSISAGNGISVSPSTGTPVISLAALPSADILVGNGSNVATAVAVSGDVTLANTGAATIANSAVTNAKLANMAADTVKVNATNGSAAPTDLSMGASTTLARLASGDIVAATVAQMLTLYGLAQATPITNSLSGDVTLNNTGTFFDGPSVAQGAVGTWLATGYVTLVDTGGSAQFVLKLWDGTTVFGSSVVLSPSSNTPVNAAVSGYITSPAGNIRISVEDASRTTGKILFNQSGLSKDSTITAYRIA